MGSASGGARAPIASSKPPPGGQAAKVVPDPGSRLVDPHRIKLKLVHYLVTKVTSPSFFRGWWKNSVGSASGTTCPQEDFPPDL